MRCPIMRPAVALSALILLGAACADSGSSQPAPATGGAVTVTQGPAPSVAETASATTTPDRDLEPAPDFAMELDDGSVFVLSGEPKPVYMVFWAEW